MFVAMVEKSIFLIVPSLDGVQLLVPMPWMLVFGVEVSAARKFISFTAHFYTQILLVMVQFT